MNISPSVNNQSRTQADVSKMGGEEKNKLRPGYRLDFNPLLYWIALIYVITR